jgi:hypothetical protein
VVLDGVLRRHDEERIRQRARHAVDGHAPLAHRLEQRRLRLRRRAVDLVREHDVREDRARRNSNRRACGSKTETPIRSEGSMSEVNCTRTKRPPTARASAGGQRGLADAGDVLDEQMPACEQRRQGEPDRLGLPLEGGSDRRAETLHQIELAPIRRLRVSCRSRLHARSFPKNLARATRRARFDLTRGRNRAH